MGSKECALERIKQMFSQINITLTAVKEKLDKSTEIVEKLT